MTRLLEVVNNFQEKREDEIDLRAVFKVLWEKKRLILWGTICATLLAFGAGFILPKSFRSEGFFQFGNPNFKISDTAFRGEGYIKAFRGEGFFQFDNPNFKISDTEDKNPSHDTLGFPMGLYKSFSSQFYNPNRLISYAAKSNLISEEEIKEIATKLAKPEDISKWIKPVYAFSKDDAREFTQLPKDEANSAIGVKITIENDSPKLAHDYVYLLGSFVRDCLLYRAISNYITEGYSTTQTKILKVENDIIGTKFELIQYAKKKEDIQRILLDYPESSKIDSRQLVSVQEGGARFLSPTTQLVGIESTIADLNRLLSALNLQEDKLKIRFDFFSKCNGLLKDEINGEQIFMKVKSIKDEILNKSIEKDDDSITESFNTLNIEMQTFEFVYFLSSRFVSGPTLPTVYISPRKSIITTITCIGSFLALSVGTLLVQWWHGSQKQALPDNNGIQIS